MARFLRKNIQITSNASNISGVPVYLEFTDSDIGSFAYNKNYVWFSNSTAVPTGDTVTQNILPFDWNTLEITGGVFAFKGWVKPISISNLTTIQVFATNDPIVAITPNYALRYQNSTYLTGSTWSSQYRRVFRMHDAKDIVNDAQTLLVSGSPIYQSSAGVLDGAGCGVVDNNGFFYDNTIASPNLWEGIECFFKPSSLNTATEYTLLSSETTSNVLAFRIAITPEASSNYYRLSITDGAGSTSLSNVIYLDPNLFHHIGVQSRSGSGYTYEYGVFLNGTSVLSHNSNTGISATSRVKFGGSGTTTNFIGQIDEARLLFATSNDFSMIFRHSNHNYQNYIPSIGTLEYIGGEFNITPSGGLTASGSAQTSPTYNLETEGGLLASGETENQNVLTSTFEGGILRPPIYTVIQFRIDGVWYTNSFVYDDIGHNGISVGKANTEWIWRPNEGTIDGGIIVCGDAYDTLANPKVTTKSGGTATSWSDYPDSVAWLRTTDALTTDSYAAYANFETGKTRSEYLHIKNFNFNLDPHKVITGLMAKVVRAGRGQTKDYYIGFAYTESGILKTTQPGLQRSGVWDEYRETVYYGGLDERWNKPWTHTEINDPEFGLLIAAQGEADSGSAMIDAIEISVYYNNHYQQYTFGGSKCGGTADVQATYTHYRWSAQWVGGVHCFSPSIHTIIPEGGVSIGGISPAPYVKPIFGGINIGGASSYQYIGTYYVLWHPQDRDILGGEAVVWSIDYEESNVDFKVGGESPIENTYHVQGGQGSTGSADVQTFLSIDTTGGLKANSNASIFPFIAEGGISVTATAETTFMSADLASGGGCKTSGTAVIKYQTTNLGSASVLTLSGSAYDYRLYIKTTSGGIRAAWEIETAIVTPFIETASGGILVRFDQYDTALIDPYVMLGGASPGGTAETWSIFNNPRSAYYYTVHGDGSQSVPPDVNDKWCSAIFEIDESFKKLKFWIYHNYEEGKLDSARIRRGWPGEVAPEYPIWSIEDYQQLGNPIQGGLPIYADLTSQEIQEIKDGYWFIQIRDDWPSETVRAQIYNYSGFQIGGTADIVSLVPCPADGGIRTSGTASLNREYYPSASSGAKIGGVGLVSYANAASSISIRGTARFGGSAYEWRTYTDVGSGGVKLNGNHANTGRWSETGSGGALCNTFVLLAITPHLEYGGLSCAGVSVEKWIAEPICSSGLITGGIHVQSFIDYYTMPNNPAKIGGSCGVERLLYMPPPIPRLGWGRAMASENILDETTTPQGIMSSWRQVIPSLPENRVRTELIGQWCDFEDSCRHARLPKVQQNRQDPYLPPKSGRVTPRDRGIARQT